MGIKIHKLGIELLPEQIAGLISDNIHEIIRNTVTQTLIFENIKFTKLDVAVILCSDVEIQKLNKQYLNKDAPTDVLCFPYSTSGEIKSDIFISVEQAYYNIPGNEPEINGRKLYDELQFLIIHGVLHLTGWDDPDDNKRNKMLSRQKQILNRINSNLPV